jgi:periplasmic divalent cation tolerance protein
VNEPDVRLVLLSGPDAETLESIAAQVVEEGWAACVNVIPSARSVYRWKGEVVRENEALAFVKTVRPALEGLRRRILDLHPYDVPEFLVLPLEAGDARYVAWVHDAVTAATEHRESDGEA